MLHIVILLMLLLSLAAFVTATDFDQDAGFLEWLSHSEPGVSVLFESIPDLFSHSPATPCASTDHRTDLSTDTAQDADRPFDHGEAPTQDTMRGSATLPTDDTALAGAHFADQPQTIDHDNHDQRELIALGLENLHSTPIVAPSRSRLQSAWQDDPASIPSSSRYGLLSPPPTRSSHSDPQHRGHAGTQPNRLMYPATPSVTSLNDSETSDLTSALSCPASSSSARSTAAPAMSRSRSQPGNRFRRHSRASGGPILHCCPKDLRLMLFNTKSELVHHRRYDVPDSERAHQCEVFGCPKGFVSPHERDRHLGTHGIVRIPKVYCPWLDCGRNVLGFPRKDNFDRHIRNVHDGLLPESNELSTGS